MILLRINWPNCVQFSIRLGERWALRIFQWSVTQKTSNPGKIQDSVKSMTGPINKRLSWKIQDGWSPYIILYRIVTSRLCRVYWHCSFGYSLLLSVGRILYVVVYWMLYVVHLSTACRWCVLPSLIHTVSCYPVVLLRSGVLPPSLCMFRLVASSPTRAVEETAPSCQSSAVCTCMLSRSLCNSWLLLLAVPVPACRDIFGAAWSPAPSRSCPTPSALRTSLPAAYRSIMNDLLYNLFFCACMDARIIV